MTVNPTPPRHTLDELADALAAGRTSAAALVQDGLARIDDPEGEGSRTFMAVDRDGAVMAAEAMDRLRAAGAAPSRFAGIPIAVKDLFDIRGQVTRAGSVILSDRAPAGQDAVAVARLRRMGFVLLGRTTMTEFAYSGLGLNPHHGTPRSPWRRGADPGSGHVAGGSSSGSAVAVADGMASAALGTDTGGSCRIPAAFTGVVGWKPTARRVPQDGSVPLAPSLDSVGPIARSVRCCAALDAILAGDPDLPLAARDVRGLRFAVPTTLVLDGLDEAVGSAFARALACLSEAGAVLSRIAVPEFDEVAGLNARGGVTAPECYAWHRRLLAERREGYDPRVSVRIARGEAMSAADYIDNLAARASLAGRATARLSRYDAVLMPTVPVAPPRLEDLVSDKAYGRANLLVLRNPSFINMIDGCAISLPMHREGDAPAGLSVAGVAGRDRAVLEIAAGIEGVLASTG